MKCNYCGTDVDATSEYCAYCGRNVRTGENPKKKDEIITLIVVLCASFLFIVLSIVAFINTFTPKTHESKTLVSMGLFWIIPITIGIVDSIVMRGYTGLKSSENGKIKAHKLLGNLLFVMLFGLINMMISGEIVILITYITLGKYWD